jgi:ferredoxin
VRLASSGFPSAAVILERVLVGVEHMKIRINKAGCVGHARCAAIAPELFTLDDDGYIAVTEIDVPPGQEALARRGARACPERIITVEDDEK